jgi:hypothetical protein
MMLVGFDPASGRNSFFLTSFNSLRPLRVRFREGLGLELVYFLKFDLDHKCLTAVFYNRIISG